MVVVTCLILLLSRVVEMNYVLNVDGGSDIL